MKCASAPSAYRNCILRASVLTGRNFSPARNVRSITAPSAARRSFVRTNAPPLPGLTCWNSRILKIVPSTSMWLPFLNWFVEIISTVKASRTARRVRSCSASGRTTPGSADGSAGGADPAERLRAAADGLRPCHAQHPPAVGLQQGLALGVLGAGDGVVVE